jgi:hypothetical protein
MKDFQKKYFEYLFTALLFVLPVLIIGCGLPGEVPLTNFDDVKIYFREVMINEDFFSSEEGILGDDEASEISKLSGITDDGTIYPRRFGRIIRSVERMFDYELQNDTLAVVTMTRTISGEFRIFFATSVLGVASDMVSKDFTEENVRKAKFLKVADTGLPENDWKLVAISLLEGGTQERNFNINSMTVRFRGDENPRTFFDPLSHFFRIGYGMRTIPRADYDPVNNFRTGIEVKITSPHSEREIVFLRQGGGVSDTRIGTTVIHPAFLNRTRMVLQSEVDVGNGLFERTYILQWVPGMNRGRLCTLAEVLSHTTLSNIDAPVESHYWGVPFVVD